MNLEKVGRAGKHLSLRLLVPDRGQQAAIVPAHAHEVVFHATLRNSDPLFVADGLLLLDGPTAGRCLHQPQAVAELDHLATRVRIDVEDGRAISIAGDLLEGAGGNAQRGERNLREVALRLLVHPVDARTGKDVVELIEQQRLPQDVQLAGGVGAARDGPHLGLAQRLLGKVVQAFRA